jgi:hypothetical protein
VLGNGQNKNKCLLSKGRSGSLLLALVESIWQNAVWNDACQGWDITAVLQGIGSVSTSNLGPLSTYNVGLATIFLASGGNHTMQLALQSIGKWYDRYTFNVTEQFNHIPPLSNITYNSTAMTYSISNHTASSYLLDPNLSFPSLGLELYDPSIPFKTNGAHPPAANLIRHNGTYVFKVLNTVTLSPNDCTLLKVCGMTRDGTEEDFQIALGIVMMEQFVYSVACSKGSGIGNYDEGSEYGGFTIWSSPGGSGSSKGSSGDDDDDDDDDDGGDGDGDGGDGGD